MSQLSIRSALTLAVSLPLLGIACGSDQKVANTAENSPATYPGDASAAMTAQPAGDAAPPNSIPNSTPPSSPASGATPQGHAESSSNSLGMPGTTTPTAPKPELSESQVAMLADLANTSEIEQGKLAQTKAKAPSVKKFAGMMVKHHTDAKNEQKKLFDSLKLTPMQSQNATTLKNSADETLSTLRGTQAADFDRTYMDGQVAAHQQVLELIDQQLLPAATDQPLIDGLKKMRATVESHLTEAKNIQAELSKTSSR